MNSKGQAFQSQDHYDKQNDLFCSNSIREESTTTILKQRKQIAELLATVSYLRFARSQQQQKIEKYQENLKAIIDKNSRLITELNALRKIIEQNELLQQQAKEIGIKEQVNFGVQCELIQTIVLNNSFENFYSQENNYDSLGELKTDTNLIPRIIEKTLKCQKQLSYFIDINCELSQKNRESVQQREQYRQEYQRLKKTMILPCPCQYPGEQKKIAHSDFDEASQSLTQLRDSQTGLKFSELLQKYHQLFEQYKLLYDQFCSKQRNPQKVSEMSFLSSESSQNASGLKVQKEDMGCIETHECSKIVLEDLFRRANEAPVGLDENQGEDLVLKDIQNSHGKLKVMNKTLKRSIFSGCQRPLQTSETKTLR